MKRFLCPVLLKLASPHEGVRGKVCGFIYFPFVVVCYIRDFGRDFQVMQMLSNINVRVKSDQVLKLPVTALYEQLLNPQISAIVKNFSIIYLDMGYVRLPLEEKLALLPKLLVNISQKQPAHQTVIFHMVLPVCPLFFRCSFLCLSFFNNCLPLQILGNVRVPDKLEDLKVKFPFVDNPRDVTVIMAFLLDTLLFSAKNR